MGLLLLEALLVLVTLGLGIHAIKNNEKLNSLIEGTEI